MKSGMRESVRKSRAIKSCILLALSLGQTSDAFSCIRTPSRRLRTSLSSSSSSSSSTTTLSLSELQEKAAPIASSFSVSEPFEPSIKGGHLQTILGFLLRDYCSYVPVRTARDNSNGGAAAATAQQLVSAITRLLLDKQQQDGDDFWDHRERVETPDGDWFHADTKYSTINNDDAISTTPTVILLHGLQSNSNSTLSKDMARAFTSMGLNCVCLNFRGCSGLPNDTLGGYHLGFTDDLKHYLNLFRQRRNNNNHHHRHHAPPIYLSGFSLGANVALKCLGELGVDAVRDYNIHGAAVLCAPLDQTRNAPVMAQPGTIQRAVYSTNLLQSLRGRAQEQLERFCDNNPNTDLFDYPRILQAKTITEFDDAFIAPIYGFESCWDYYQKTSSIHFLDKIPVPTLILNAADDPFFDPSVWPIDKTVQGGGTAPIKMIRTKHGGHLGFCFHQVKNDDDDDEQQFQSLLKEEKKNRRPASWASTQAARFVQHVHTARSKDMSLSSSSSS